jgi:DNA modification methylase
VKPYYEHAGITIYHGDCRELLSELRADSIFADPPYGIGKAEWDTEFPFEWMPKAAAAAEFAMAITPGVGNLALLPYSFGGMLYRWTWSIRVVNGMTFKGHGVGGFANWIACMVYARPQVGLGAFQDATEVTIDGVKPEHPSPKPYKAMRWIVERLPGHSVLDPFCGSGTTLVAAKQLGRRAIGIEIEERYCEIAAKRLSQEVFDFGDVASDAPADCRQVPAEDLLDREDAQTPRGNQEVGNG